MEQLKNLNFQKSLKIHSGANASNIFGLKTIDAGFTQIGKFDGSFSLLTGNFATDALNISNATKTNRDAKLAIDEAVKLLNSSVLKTKADVDAVSANFLWYSWFCCCKSKR